MCMWLCVTYCGAGLKSGLVRVVSCVGLEVKYLAGGSSFDDLHDDVTSSVFQMLRIEAGIEQWSPPSACSIRCLPVALWHLAALSGSTG